MPTGVKIKEIRQQRGLTQKQLGDMCGIADANIRKYENGKQNPKIETLQKIANALNVSIYELMTDDKNNLVIHNSLNERDFQEHLSRYFKNSKISDTNKENLYNTIILKSEKEVQSSLKRIITAEKSLLDSHFEQLNMDGRKRAIDQIETLTKVPEYRKDTISDNEILSNKAKSELKDNCTDDKKI